MKSSQNAIVFMSDNCLLNMIADKIVIPSHTYMNLHLSTFLRSVMENLVKKPCGFHKVRFQNTNMKTLIAIPLKFNQKLAVHEIGLCWHSAHIQQHFLKLQNNAFFPYLRSQVYILIKLQLNQAYNVWHPVLWHPAGRSSCSIRIIFIVNNNKRDGAMLNVVLRLSQC